jgi:hypothetical protein
VFQCFLVSNTAHVVSCWVCACPDDNQLVEWQRRAHRVRVARVGHRGEMCPRVPSSRARLLATMSEPGGRRAVAPRSVRVFSLRLLSSCVLYLCPTDTVFPCSVAPATRSRKQSPHNPSCWQLLSLVAVPRTSCGEQKLVSLLVILFLAFQVWKHLQLRHAAVSGCRHLADSEHILQTGLLLAPERPLLWLTIRMCGHSNGL